MVSNGGVRDVMPVCNPWVPVRGAHERGYGFHTGAGAGEGKITRGLPMTNPRHQWGIGIWLGSSRVCGLQHSRDLFTRFSVPKYSKSSVPTFILHYVATTKRQP